MSPTFMASMRFMNVPALERRTASELEAYFLDAPSDPLAGSVGRCCTVLAMAQTKRILTINSHEAWVHQLSYLDDVALDIVDGAPGRYCAHGTPARGPFLGERASPN